MKFSEELLKKLNISPVIKKEPVNVIKVKEALAFMEQCAQRIKEKSYVYTKASNADIELDCIDIVTAKLNEFTQVFKDLIVAMRKHEGTYNGNGQSLRYAMSSYDTFGFKQTSQEKEFLKELLLRNEITHDYFNWEIHRQKLISLMTNCSDGALDVYDNLLKYCNDNNLMEIYLDKNAK